MSHRNKYIIAIVLILILIIGFSYWSFFSKAKLENIEPAQLTEQQKLDILSAISQGSSTAISDSEKKKILSREVSETESTSSLSIEEKMKILSEKF